MEATNETEYPWTFVPSRDAFRNGIKQAVPDEWRNEETGEVVYENPNQKK